jgi:hypothetical protein
MAQRPDEEITEVIPLIGTIIFWVVANVFGNGKWRNG